MPSQLPRPLTRVPSYLLLKRCSELLHTPVENICLTSVAVFDMLGTVIMPNLYDGRRDFRITAEQYYDPQAKIEFPRQTPPQMTQEEIDRMLGGAPMRERFLTATWEQEENAIRREVYRTLLHRVILYVLCPLVALGLVLALRYVLSR